MVLVTKENISEDLLAASIDQEIMLETKFGIKKVIISVIPISRSLSLKQGRGQNGYIINRVQGPHLLRSDAPSLILHGLPKDIVKFIKNDDYCLGKGLS